MYENREVFANAPLEFVAGEVRFPYAPQLSKDEAFGRLADAFRGRFPIPQREHRPQGVEISPEGMKPVEAHDMYRFLNRSHTASVTVVPAAVTVETTDYSEFSDFRELLAGVLDVVESFNAVVGVERVGLRYIDELRVPQSIGQPRDWLGYVSEDVLAPLTVATGYQPASLEGVIRLNCGEARGVLLRYAAMEGSGVVGGGPLKRRSRPAEGPFFVVDIDSYWSSEGGDVPDFSAASVLETFDALHKPVGVLFLRMVTEQFKDEVARRAKDD